MKGMLDVKGLEKRRCFKRDFPVVADIFLGGLLSTESFLLFSIGITRLIETDVGILAQGWETKSTVDSRHNFFFIVQVRESWI